MMIKIVKGILQAIAIVHIIGGLVLPWAVHSTLFQQYGIQFSIAFHNSNSIGFKNQGEFLTGLFGPSIASWGILFAYVIDVSFRSRDRRGWWTMIIACLTWATYDSFLSIWNGIYINAILNSFIAIMIIIPLSIVKQYFFTSLQN